MDGLNIGQNRPDLTFNAEPCVSSDVQALGQLANTMVDTEGKMSAGDKLLLKNAAEAMLMSSPNLPAPDKEALTNWLSLLNTVQVSVSSGDDQAPLDPKSLQQLLSTKPEDVEQGLDTLISSRLTPEQKTIRKDGLSKVALAIAQKNDQSGTTNNLKSWDPAVIKQELLNLLKDAGVELSPDDQTGLEDALQSASEDISTLNIISGEPPAKDSVLDTLQSSTNEAEVFNALMGQVDCSNMSDDDVAALKSQLQELAAKIADANSSGQPLPELKSTDGDAIGQALTGLLDLSSVSDKAKAAINNAISEIGKTIADKIKSEFKANLFYNTGLELAPAGTGNPYLKPGIMALLAPIMSELAKIYSEVIAQSSKMKQNMMGLMLAMAKEAFSFAIEAGKAKVDQLQIEMTQYIASAAMSGAMIGVSVFSTALQMGYGMRKADSWVGEQNKAGGVPTEEYTQAKAAQKDWLKMNPGKDPNGPDSTFPKIPDGMPKTREATALDFYKSAEGQHFHTQSNQVNTFVNTVVGQMGQMGDNVIKAVFTGLKIDPVMREAEMNAMKDFISQLINVITDTMRTFGDEAQRADKDWQAFNQLFRDMGSTIRQAFYSQA